MTRHYTDIDCDNLMVCLSLLSQQGCPHWKLPRVLAANITSPLAALSTNTCSTSIFLQCGMRSGSKQSWQLPCSFPESRPQSPNHSPSPFLTMHCTKSLYADNCLRHPTLGDDMSYTVSLHRIVLLLSSVNLKTERQDSVTHGANPEMT